MCGMCKTTYVHCSFAFVALHWGGVGFFSINLYFCMFLLSIMGRLRLVFPVSCYDVRSMLLGSVSVDFDAAGQILIVYSIFVKYLRKNGNTMKQHISYL